MRKRARKRVTLPGGDSIYIPCIQQISFSNAAEQYQEYNVFCDSSPTSSRQIHVDQVPAVAVDADGNPTGGGAIGTDKLYVERIDAWNTKTMADQAQEQKTYFDNKNGADTLPPRFITHKKTHIYRYFKDPANPSNTLSWIDVELIDELNGVTAADQYQETLWLLDNPFNGDLSGQVNSSDDDITIGSGEGTSDNPVRIDPFQNIVNWSGSPPYIIFGFTVICSGSGFQLVASTGSNNFLPFPAGYAFSVGYTTAQKVNSFPSTSPAFSNGGELVNWSGGPAINNNLSFGPSQYMGSFGTALAPRAGQVKVTFSGAAIYTDPDTSLPVPGFYTDAAGHYEVYNWPIGNDNLDYYTSPPAAPDKFIGTFCQSAFGGGDFGNESAFANATLTDSGSWGFSGFSCTPVSGPHAGHAYNAVAMSLSGGILCKPA